MPQKSYLYLGKFVVNDGDESRREVLVIREHGGVCFVGPGIDHPGNGGPNRLWGDELCFVLVELGVEVHTIRYVQASVA